MSNSTDTAILTSLSGTTWKMFINLRLAVERTQTEATCIASITRRMLVKLMALKIIRSRELSRTFAANVIFHASVLQQVTFQLSTKQKFLWTKVTRKPTAFVVFINEMFLVLYR